MTFRKICSSLCLVSLLSTSLVAKAGAPGAVASVVSTATAKAKESDGDSSLRLPRFALPVHYDLQFEPDMKTFTFKGSEQITIVVSSETKTLVLNAAELSISDASIVQALDVASGMSVLPGGTERKVLVQGTIQRPTIELDAAKELVKLQFKSALAPGRYVLNCHFKGSLNDDLRGFYRSAYVDNGVTHFLCATQMEPTDARRMFPSFDEPDFKATYQITATVDSNLTAISNAPIAKTDKQGNGKKVVKFEVTPKMSSYLVALIIGDLKSSATKVSNGIPITVWTTPGKEHLAEYALNTAAEILPVQEKYFGIPYPGKKLDLIALPDFDAGAMENLGAITFREARLLVDNKTGTSFLKRTIASIEAHEMAHQWFGDLVTMRWWDDLWLNEAFATWMATKTVNIIHPEWRFLAKFVGVRNDAMGDDQLQSTRAIHAHVSNPAQAVEMFDGITYEKGASILRMLEVFVGVDTFQKGIHDYLSSHAFGNAMTEELWKAIATASGDSVAVPEVMKAWVYQAGFPLLTVGAQAPEQPVNLDQSRYFEASDAPASKTLWQIPIVFHRLGDAVNTKASSQSVDSNAADTKLLATVHDTFEPAAGKGSLFANKDGSGFFRVRYAQQDFRAIADKFALLSPEERLAFLSDTGALAESGKVPVENILDLLLKIRDEKDPLVLAQLVIVLKSPYTSMNADSMAAYQKLVCSLLGPLKQQYGWQATDGEPELTKDLRIEVLKLLGTYGQDKATITEANDRYHQYMHDHSSVNPDLVPAILNIVAFNGAQPEYDEMETAWKSSKAPEDEKRFLRTLTEFKRSELIAKTLDLVVSGQIRAQDSPGILGSMLEQVESQEQAWAFTKQNWVKILKLFPPTSMRKVAASCSEFYRKKDEQDLKSFFATHKVPFAASAVARSLESVHIKVLYEERYANRVRQWVATRAAGN